MLDDNLKKLADRLTPEQRAALRPCAKDRRCLLKDGIAHWKSVPGHRYEDIKLTNKGFKIRDYLGLSEPL